MSRYRQRLSAPLLLLVIYCSCISLSVASQNYTASSQTLVQQQVSLFEKRPKDCPPCFNCNLEGFECWQYSECDKSTGRCACIPGFGNEKCNRPLCGSLPNKNRAFKPPRKLACDCDEGWGGLNCNVCTKNSACNAMLPTHEGGVCYTGGYLVKQNHMMCNVTNKGIIKQIGGDIPQATISCKNSTGECNFQFWVNGMESFYCGMDTCQVSVEAQSDKRNVTKYECDNIRCSCIANRDLCGKGGLFNIDDFLRDEVRGPGFFQTIQTLGGSDEDGSIFSEPAMNKLITQIFAEDHIKLKCFSGECMHKTEVPGYAVLPPTINSTVVAGVIAGCALFVVGVALLIWYLSSQTGKRRGPIYLPDDGEDIDENSKLMTDHKPAALHFQNVAYNLNGKQILAGVQGGVRPGEVLAIMGASGAGKTTFLDILARKNKRGTSGGDFYINGEKIADDDFRGVIGFVDQDDTMLPTLTVHETILDSAMLRLPRSMGLAAKEHRVDEVEKQLGIYHIRDQIIGSEEGSGRGISGGEKRRVGIACELVTSPSILFLDEPTSGLDAFNAFNVVECLVNLVKTYNRTVVFTIHQPRSNIVALFDQLILLAKGRAVYSGPFGSCQTYFDSIGYSCPPGFNIADYLIDLTMHAGAERGTLDFLDADLNSQTRSSSVMAVKSIASTSNFSVSHGQGESAGAADSARRPLNRRRTSIKQQQEQQLFSRKKPEQRSGTDTPTSARTADEVPLDSNRETYQSWVSLSKQSGNPPPQVLDEAHQLPPDATATGTDLDHLVTSYNISEVASSVREDIESTVNAAGIANGPGNSNNLNSGTFQNPTMKGFRKVGILGQFRILSVRTWRNLYRNPMLMLTHYAISIVLAVLLGYFFNNLTADVAGFQNRLGLLFFILALFGFSTLTTLTVFSAERLIFARERAKGYYHPISYFTAKVLFDIIPLRLIPPIILGAIVYPMVGLVWAGPEFGIFIMFLVLFNLAAAVMCLFVGIVCRNQGVANLLGSLVMLFSLLFAGFLLNHKKIPKAVLWLQKLSIFHYGFEGLIVNEVKHLTLQQHSGFGYEIEAPGGVILSEFGFDAKAVWPDAAGLAIFAGVFVVVAYVSMHVLLIEQR